MRTFLLLCLLFPLAALAGKNGPTLSERDYKLLVSAQELIEGGKLTQAYKKLSPARDAVGNDYARALVEHNLGLLELQRDRYSQALAHLNRAYAFEQLPQEQQNNILRTRAQLNCMEDNWQVCIDLLRQWMALVPDKVKDTDHLMLAQAYSQLEQWANVIAPISAAINSRSTAPENWYQLKIAAHVRLKQWRPAIVEQKRMMRHYGDDPGNWRQLVSLHNRVNDHKASLAVQRIGFERGLLRESRDYRMLAQMQMRAGMPYYAGKVMAAGMERGTVKRNRKNLQALSNYWMQARETEKAIAALQQLRKLRPDILTLTQLAQMQMDTQDWKAARGTLQSALKLGKGKQERLQLMLGIVDTKLQDYAAARQALLAAAGDKQLKPSAEGWLNYLHQLEPTAAAPIGEG